MEIPGALALCSEGMAEVVLRGRNIPDELYLNICEATSGTAYATPTVRLARGECQ